MVDFISQLPIYIYLILPVISIASWLVESYKWQLLVRDLEKLRFRVSVTHNLTAQAASFLTPLKAGEFATKAFYFQSSIRKKVIKAVLIGNLSQMAVTIILGLAGIALLFEQHVLAVLIFITSSGLLMLLSKTVSTWFKFNAARIDVVTAISFVRYLVFSSCWFLVLYIISDVSIVWIFGSIAAMYLAASIIPTMQVFDVFLKWSIASFFVGYLDISLESMTAIVAIIWLNNQVLPVLLGCGLLAFQRFPKLVTA